MALSTRDKVRLRIGDTDPDAPILNDEEVDDFLTEHGDDVYAAAAACCDAIAAKYATAFDFDTDNQSFKRSQVVEAYRKLARDLRAHGEGAGAVTTTRVDGYSQDIPNDRVTGATSSTGRRIAGVGAYGYEDPQP